MMRVFCACTSLVAADKWLWTWSIVGRWRQKWHLEGWLLTSQGFQESNNLVDFRLFQGAAKLQARHDVSCLFQGPVSTVVEVGVGQFNVAQGWYLELEAVQVVAGQASDTFSRVLGNVVFIQTHFLEGVATNVNAVVTGSTADALEQLIAFEFLLGDGLVITLEPQVKARIRCYQGFFKLGNGIGNFVDGDFFGVVNLLEAFHILWNRFNYVDCQLMGKAHFQRVCNRTASLLLQVGSTTVPELGDVKAGVEHGWRVDRAFLPLVTDGGWNIVSSAHAQVVAGVTRNKSRL